MWYDIPSHFTKACFLINLLVLKILQRWRIQKLSAIEQRSPTFPVQWTDGNGGGEKRGWFHAHTDSPTTSLAQFPMGCGLALGWGCLPQATVGGLGNDWACPWWEHHTKGKTYELALDVMMSLFKLAICTAIWHEHSWPDTDAVDYISYSTHVQFFSSNWTNQFA